MSGSHPRLSNTFCISATDKFKLSIMARSASPKEVSSKVAPTSISSALNSAIKLNRSC